MGKSLLGTSSIVMTHVLISHLSSESLHLFRSCSCNHAGMHARSSLTIATFLSVVIATPARLSVPQLQGLGCASIVGNETCTECIAACASAFVLCTATCTRRPAQCEVNICSFDAGSFKATNRWSTQQACIHRFSSWGGCNTCLPECIPKKDAEALACASSLMQTLNATAPNPTPSPRAHIASVPGWAYKGCYTDSVTHRALEEKRWRGRWLTVQRCADVCKGYKYFGVEYSNESVLIFERQNRVFGVWRLTWMADATVGIRLRPGVARWMRRGAATCVWQITRRFVGERGC